MQYSKQEECVHFRSTHTTRSNIQRQRGIEQDSLFPQQIPEASNGVCSILHELMLSLIADILGCERYSEDLSR